MKTDFSIGQNLTTGAMMGLDYDDMRNHWLLVGGTGRGKSKLLELRMRYHLQHNHGVLLLDPHGMLYDDVLAYVTAAGYRNRVVLINPNDAEHSVGLNFLARSGMDVSAQASQVMNAIAKVFGETEGETKPRLERWQRNLIMSLIEANLTLADMLDFLSVSDSSYRQSVLHDVTNQYVKREWQGFDSISKRAEKENLIEAPLNRAAKMILSDPIRRIIGQQDSTISIEDAIENGKIVLVNLAPIKVSRECQQILGILLIDQVRNYAFQRDKKKARRPFCVVVDEAADLVADDLPYSLQALRKFGIYFSLCYQTLAQIRRISGYCDSVMANCDVKIAFKSSRADSEDLVGELFAGEFRGDIVKDEIYRTMLLPVESEREIVSRSTSKSRTVGEVSTEGYSESSGRGYGSAVSSGISSATHFVPGDGFMHPLDTVSYSDGDSSAHVMSDFDSTSSGSSSSTSESRSDTDGESHGTTIVPFYEYIREQELSSRQYYSIEEMKEKFIAWIMCQPQRHAHIKVKDDKVVPIFVSFVEEVPVRPKEILKVVKRSQERYALPATVVDGLLEERRKQIVRNEKKLVLSQEEETAIRENRWQ